MTDDRHEHLLRPTAAERAPWELSPEAEDFIESAKVLAEPYREEIGRLTAELSMLRAQRDAALALCDEAELNDYCDARGYLVVGSKSLRAALGIQPEPANGD